MIDSKIISQVSKSPLFSGDSEIDQLFRIFRVLGTPTEETWPGVSELPEYKCRFPNWEQIDLRRDVGRLDRSGLDLLSSMLTCDPSSRPSADECLDHCYFDELPEDVSSLTHLFQANEEG